MYEYSYTEYTRIYEYRDTYINIIYVCIVYTRTWAILKIIRFDKIFVLPTISS